MQKEPVERRKHNDCKAEKRCAESYQEAPLLRPDAEDNLGCGDKRCKYRDVDGACNINNIEADAADVIEKLLQEVEKYEHR